MAELMAYAGTKATKAMEQALERSKEWTQEPRVSVSVEGLTDVMQTLDKTLTTAQTLDEVLEGALYVRMLLGAVATAR